jgi:hypothetical protein
MRPHSEVLIKMSNSTGVGVPVVISVTPIETLNFGGTVQLNPTVTDIEGTVQTATSPYTFSSSNTTLATVDSSGLVTATMPADTTVLNNGGVIEISVSYPYANRLNGDTMSAMVTITVLANAARTQAIVRCDDTQYARPAISKWVEYKVVPALAPPPEYPPGWVITNN